MSAEQPRLPAALTAVSVGPTHGSNHNGGTTAVTSAPATRFPSPVTCRRRATVLPRRRRRP